MNYSQIEEWLLKKLQWTDGVSTDYVSIRQKFGQSFEQVARVKTDGKPPKEAAEAVIDAIKDAFESADADGKSAVKIQLRVYRSKEEDGCKIFSGGSVDPQSEPRESREGELVATLRELRMLASETTEIQLKIEREAVKKEKDEASQKRLGLIEEEIDKLEREYADLEEVWKAEKAGVQGSQQIKEEIERLRLQMEEARRKGDWQKMSELQYGRMPELEAKLKQADKGEQDAAKPKLLRTQVGAEEIAEVVSRATGIPVSKMMQGERDKLLQMEDELHKRVVGQHEAITAVSDAIRRSRAGLSDPNRPYGSFMFLGPTGVGKTELTKALAAFLFDTEEALIRIDMSEFMEKHSVARLIGAPPGYVGYEEGGYLTEAVRRKPYSVILLDEIEKAHPDVFNVLLQVLDDGRMTDGQGRTVDFKNTVVVMTSNLGSHKIQSMEDSDPQLVKLAVMAEVRGHFRPEFINRIDELVVFHALDDKHIGAIAKIQLNTLQQRLGKMEIGLHISDAALRKLAEAGFDPVYGARPLKRAIQQEVENPLSKAILEGRFGPKDTVEIEVAGSELGFRKAA